jgi:hypothetical protein
VGASRGRELQAFHVAERSPTVGLLDVSKQYDLTNNVHARDGEDHYVALPHTFPLVDAG